MKINKKKPSHWLIVFWSSALIILLIPLSIMKNKGRPRIILYGHKLNGNLKAFYEYLAKKSSYEVYYLTMDPAYYKMLITNSYDIKVLNMCRPHDVAKIVRGSMIITDHGLQNLVLLQKIAKVRFVDVWHGIPYKGIDDTEMRQLHGYNQAWVSSPTMKKMYVNKFGFSPEKVKVTGYARVDQLVNNSLDRNKIVKKYDIKNAKKYVLIAPTWAQDDKGRSLLPFGVKDRTFFGEIEKIAKKHDTLVIFRTHLNSSENIDAGKLTNTVFMPYAKYENAEEFLYIADILVTDWSSIAFDFLALDRPTIFLDVKAPFKKGFSLGPEYRFGKIVGDFEGLKDALDTYLRNPKKYLGEHRGDIKKAKRTAYGATLDGKSCVRYEKEIDAVLKT